MHASRMVASGSGWMNVAMVDFLTALFEHGRVRVARPNAREANVRAGDASGNEVAAILRSCGEALAVEFPGDPPPFDIEAAFWGATIVYRAAQLAVYRDLGAEAVKLAPGDPPPPHDDPSACWSVDICLRFLPDLHRLSAGLATDDPLAARLREIALAWPLCSVGMRQVEVDTSRAGWLDHDGLRRLYVDRVIAARDRSRLADPRVRLAVREALGAFPELAPDLVEPTIVTAT